MKYDWKIRQGHEQARLFTTEVDEGDSRTGAGLRAVYPPQKEFADAVIGIEYSGYGRELGRKRHNVYRVTLVPEPDEHTSGTSIFPSTCYSILSLSERNFSLEFVTGERNGQRMGRMIMDGELSAHVVRKLEHSIEEPDAGLTRSPSSGTGST